MLTFDFQTIATVLKFKNVSSPSENVPTVHEHDTYIRDKFRRLYTHV